LRHQQIKRIVDGAKTAILFIHGIIGTPDQFNDLLPLVRKDISIYNILLDGHGKGVRDFSSTSMKKWEKQVENAVEKLALNHEKIIIVGHSMGTLFAIEQAIKCEKVEELFLMNIPISIFVKPRMLLTTVKVYFNKVTPDDKIATAAEKSYGICDRRNVFLYLGWIPRYLELFSKIRKTRKILPKLSVRCNAFQSSKDEMVAKSSIKYLKKHSKMTVNKLKNSGHYYYRDDDLNFVKNKFKDMIERIPSDNEFQQEFNR